MREITEGIAVAYGLAWPECPRWTDDGLLFSDMHAGKVYRLENDEAIPLVTLPSVSEDVDTLAGGIGLTASGALLVASMRDRLVYIARDGGIEVFSDLREIASGLINDMIVLDDGTTLISQFGFDLFAREAPVNAPLLSLSETGQARAMTELGDFESANGLAISDGELFIAESFGARITAVTLDGERHGSARTFAETPPVPDGISWSEQGLWVAFPETREVLCWDHDGRKTARITLPEDAGRPAACAVGGADGRTLYICCGHHAFSPAKARANRNGSVWAVRI